MQGREDRYGKTFMKFCIDIKEGGPRRCIQSALLSPKSQHATITQAINFLAKS